MKLGLVCKLATETIKELDAKRNIGVRYKKDWNKLSISSKVCKSHKEFLSLPKEEQYNLAKNRTLKNIEYSIECIKYCIDNNIYNYRISSELIAKYEFWSWDKDIDILNKLEQIKSYDVSLTIHPDQYTILNSPKESVVNSAISILEYHAKLAQLTGIEAITLHTGGVYSDKDSALLRFAENYNKLPDNIKSLLYVENCHSFSFNDIKLLNELCNVNILYDLHHERAINNNTSLNDHIDNMNYLQSLDQCHIVHLSSSQDDARIATAHHNFITTKDIKLFIQVLASFDGIVEIEAKMKNLAVLNFRDAL